MDELFSTATSEVKIQPEPKIPTDLLNSLYSSVKPVEEQPVVIIEEPLANIDILITEPTNEKDDNNIVPDGLFNLKHEIPYDQSRPHSPIQPPPIVMDSLAEIEAVSRDVVSTLSSNELEIEHQVSQPSIARSRPTSPSIARSRPTSPSVGPVSFASIKNTSNPTIKSYTNTQNKPDSPSSSEDEDSSQKFQIRIRPRPQKVLGGSEEVNEIKAVPIPLLPRPPKSLQEIEEFRQRRNSSGAASITQSLKDEESSDDEKPR